MYFRRICVAAILVAACGGEVRANPASFFRSFDGPDLFWELIDARPNARLLSHGSANDHVRQGSGVERVTVVVPGGEAIHLACTVGRLPVMDEFESRMWLKSNRPGARLATRVILPRTKDPKTGAARSLYVSGDEYNSPDRWQQLQITSLPELLAAQVRVLRAAQRESIDPREAYVDAIVLVVPGGEGSTTVWTDALEVDGVALTVAAATEGRPAATPAVFSAPSWPQPATSPNSRSAPSVATNTAASAHFRGTTLLLSDRPFLVRGIEWNNEPFAFLAARGFNAIWLDEPPTPEQSADATRANLWLVCTPPAPDKLADEGLGASLDRVLAWNLGSPSGPHELDYYRRWADQVREIDTSASRPVLLAPQGDWLPASQIADALVARHPAAVALTRRDFADWLQQLPLLARPGTPLWTTVPTQAGPKTREQAAWLTRGDARLPTVLADRQIEDLIVSVEASGSRGLLFQSDSPLDASDAASRRRAALLEQFNDRINLIEPWLTIGKSVGDATSTDGSMSGVVIQAERSRLFLPTRTPAQSSAAEYSSRSIALVIPGVPVSNEAFALSPAGFQTLASQRIAGGTRVEVARDFAGYILMTEDASVISAFRQRVARGARRAAQVQFGLAASQSRLLGDAARQLPGFGVSTKTLDQAIGAADAELKLAGASIASGNFEAGYRQSTRALQILNLAIEDTDRRVADGPTFDSVPSVVQPAPFLARVAFDHALAKFRTGENQLVGGDFEDLEQLRQVGWQHVEDPIPGIHTSVELSGRAPHEGRYALQLVSRDDSANQGPLIVARAPVWITSPPFRASAGEVLEISGWIRIDQRIEGNVDGLQILDSLGGRELALRVRQTDGWQPFRIIRGSKETTNVTLTFALNGLGTACVDGVMVRSLAAPQVKRLPSITREPQPAFPNSARRPMYPAQLQR